MSAQLLLFAFFVISMLLMSFNYGKKKKRIVFFGDSITKQGMEPRGYIQLIKNFLNRKGLEEKYELVCSGINGNKVTDLYERLDKDVLSDGAEMVIIFVGINDVWHKEKGQGTDADKFEGLYEKIIDRLTTAGIKTIVCTPTAIGEKLHHTNKQDDDLDQYSNIICSIALKHHLPVIDLRNAFLNYNLLNNVSNQDAGILTTDGVHLNDVGNELVAEEMWKVIEPMLVGEQGMA